MFFSECFGFWREFLQHLGIGKCRGNIQFNEYMRLDLILMIHFATALTNVVLFFLFLYFGDATIFICSFGFRLIHSPFTVSARHVW